MKKLKARQRLRTIFICGIAVINVALGSRASIGAIMKAPAHAPLAHTTRVILLGTGGGPVDRKFRSQTANLLVVDGKPYLIDAGDGVVRQLAWTGYKPDQIRNIFITHHHLDHNAGLEPLMSFMWSDSNSDGIIHPTFQIYGPPATNYLVHAALDYLSVSERIFGSEMKLTPAAPMFSVHEILNDGLAYRDNVVRVTAAENSHYRFKPGSPSYHKDKSYAYRFDTLSGSVVFTGDTGPSVAVTKLAHGADVLVSEVIDEEATEKNMQDAWHLSPQLAKQVGFHMAHEHLTPEEVGKMASGAHVRLVILTHFTPGLDRETDMTGYVSGIHKYFAGPVIAGKDLFEYDLYR